jgi:hypothetical protein
MIPEPVPVREAHSASDRTRAYCRSLLAEQSAENRPKSCLREEPKLAYSMRAPHTESEDGTEAQAKESYSR